MARLYDFPAHLGQFFRQIPQPGQCHRWLLIAANKLRNRLPPEVAVAYLREYARMHIKHRDIGLKEIQRAVEKSLDASVDWKPNGTSFRWPEKEPALIETVLETMQPHFDMDPKETAASIIPRLFLPDELVCFGPSQFVAKIGTVEEVAAGGESAQFIVPNPMKGLSGIAKDGEPSTRCQDNVRCRRHLITEIDDPGLNPECQAKIIHFLMTRTTKAIGAAIPLVAIVHSGGKSLHAWWKVEGVEADKVLLFFSTACQLGADPTLWDIAKWVRMPGGTRYRGEETVPQNIIFGGWQ